MTKKRENVEALREDLHNYLSEVLISFHFNQFSINQITNIRRRHNGSITTSLNVLKIIQNLNLITISDFN